MPTSIAMHSPPERDTDVFSQCLTDLPEGFTNLWNSCVAKSEFGHLHQGYEHAVMKSRDGWVPSFFWVQKSGETIAGAMLIQKYLPGRMLSIAATPCGPFWLPGHQESLTPLLEAVGVHCRNTRATFCRLNMPCAEELYREVARFLPENRREYGHVWSYWNMARDVMRMDISGTLDDVLRRMHPDTRMKCRRSRKRGIAVRQGFPSDIPAFVSLMHSMSTRKQVLVREQQYFESLFQVYPPGRIALFVAEVEGQVAGASLAVYLGRTVWYLYGAFDYSKRQIYPSEALQLAMIEWGQDSGCSVYDMGGTCTDWPPQPTDKGYGVFVFKQRLGAEPVLLAPYCDLIYSPILWPVAAAAENIGIPLVIEKGKSKFQVIAQRLRNL